MACCTASFRKPCFLMLRCRSRAAMAPIRPGASRSFMSLRLSRSVKLTIDVPVIRATCICSWADSVEDCNCSVRPGLEGFRKAPALRECGREGTCLLQSPEGVLLKGGGVLLSDIRFACWPQSPEGVRLRDSLFNCCVQSPDNVRLRPEAGRGRGGVLLCDNRLAFDCSLPCPYTGTPRDCVTGAAAIEARY